MLDVKMLAIAKKGGGGSWNDLKDKPTKLSEFENDIGTLGDYPFMSLTQNDFVFNSDNYVYSFSENIDKSMLNFVISGAKIKLTVTQNGENIFDDTIESQDIDEPLDGIKDIYFYVENVGNIELCWRYGWDSDNESPILSDDFGVYVYDISDEMNINMDVILVGSPGLGSDSTLRYEDGVKVCLKRIHTDERVPISTLCINTNQGVSENLNRVYFNENENELCVAGVIPSYVGFCELILNDETTFNLAVDETLQFDASKLKYFTADDMAWLDRIYNSKRYGRIVIVKSSLHLHVDISYSGTTDTWYGSACGSDGNLYFLTIAGTYDDFTCTIKRLV